MRILYLPNSYSQQRQFQKPANIYPVRMAMEAEWYRKQGHEVYWIPTHYEDNFRDYLVGHYWCKQKLDKVIREPENLPFLTLPRPDRVFTRAKEYTSGNYKYLPGTHIISASGCSHGRCVFCVENGKTYETRKVEDVIEEIAECKSLGYKEVFDDSATFPTGDWLDSFCVEMMPIDMTLGCNMRVGGDVPFSRMRNAGFRMLLFGIESANQETLDKINKGVKVEDIEPTLKRATKSGLSCHGAFMFGYPWETEQDAKRTLQLCHYLLRKGYLQTAQASLYCPQGVQGNQAHKKYVKKIYDVGFSPEFWWNKLRDIHDKDDIKYLWRGIKAALW